MPEHGGRIMSGEMEPLDRSLPQVLAELLRTAQAEARAKGAVLPAKIDVSAHGDPRSALLAALEAADPADRIVVFGSFYTVGGVLEQGVPRLSAKHVG